MSDEHTIARYRRWYRKLLCCYSRPYRERFAESMEQTFNDLCRERAEAGRGLFGFVLWMCVETSAGIVGDNLRVLVMQRNIVRIAIGTGLILLVPLVAMQFTEEVNWGVFDFVAMGGLLFGTGLTYDVVARKGGTIAYRAAVGVACAAGLLLLWVNAAAGIIGDGPVNLMYLGVIAVGFVGVLLARFEPRGMAWALFATAVAQMLVPIIALAIWKSGENALFVDAGSPHPPFHPGIVPVFVLNGVFAALWIVSGLLFRRAAGTRSDAGRYERSRNALREGLAE
jgi:hypothetical protein